MLKRFEGKTVLITGGTKGLGLACAKLFAREGANVVLSYRSDEEGARAAVAEVSALGARCNAIRADLSEESGIATLFDGFTALSQKLDVYVHNAAATAFKDLLELKAHHIDKTFNITVKSFILGMQRVAALMPEGGAVVTVSGMDTLKAVPWHGLLGAAKASLETLTAYFAHELASRRIRVNGVNPGFLATDSTRKYLGPAFQPMCKMFGDATPLKREASLEEVARVMLFLASDDATWIVGQTLCVDGGLDFSLQNAVAPRE